MSMNKPLVIKSIHRGIFEQITTGILMIFCLIQIFFSSPVLVKQVVEPLVQNLFYRLINKIINLLCGVAFYRKFDCGEELIFIAPLPVVLFNFKDFIAQDQVLRE